MRLAGTAAIAAAALAAATVAGAGQPSRGTILYGGRVLCPFVRDASRCRGKPVYNSAIFAVPRIGYPPRRITTRRFDDAQPAWSPDRTRIAFVRQGRRLGSGYQVWVMNADGSRARQITRGQVDVEPDWSPDGRSIVYRGNSPNGRTFDLYVVRPDGSGRRNLTRNPNAVSVTDPSWAPDSRRIAFQRSYQDRPIGTGIYSIGVGGAGLRRLAGGGQEPAWSPDGRRIAFIRQPATEGESFQIYLIGSGGGGLRRLTRGGENVAPEWSPDGRRIAFVRNDQLTVMNADGSGIKQLTRKRRGFAVDGISW